MTGINLKAFATLQAKAALHGLTCVYTAAGNIVLSRDGGSWIFDDVDEASKWLSLAIGEVPV
jgi:hypothetical protein